VRNEDGNGENYGELHNFYASPDIIRVIKSRRKRKVGNIACMEEIGNIQRI
jgi:hypothetical protein